MLNFDPAFFVQHFEKNQSRTYLFQQSSSSLSSPSITPLLSLNAKKLVVRDLLSKLAAGEAAEGVIGRKLIQLTNNATDQKSLALYIKEEERHGIEFDWLATQYGLELDPALGKQAAWVAKLLNFGGLPDIANLVLAAEVVTVPIYREVGQRSQIPLLKQVMEEVVRDEAGHLRYHGARLKPILLKAKFWNRVRFKLIHQIGLFIIVLSARLLLSKDIWALTGLSWREMLSIIEKDYMRFYKNELSVLRVTWLFKVFRFL